MEFTKIEGVQCEKCGKLHDLNKKTFISIHGNVTLGKSDGIYGNADNTKISVFCRNLTCIEKIYKYMSDPLYDDDKDLEINPADVLRDIEFSVDDKADMTDIEEINNNLLNLEDAMTNIKHIDNIEDTLKTTKNDINGNEETEDIINTAFDPKNFE